MSGVSIEQWRGRIGRFNAVRNLNHSPQNRCRAFLILSHLMAYSKFLREYLLFPFFIIKNILLLFGFCFIAITLVSLAALFRLGIWVLFPDMFPCRGDIFTTLHLVFTFPRLISLLGRKCIYIIHTMDSNIAFRLSVMNILLLMAGIESNPGPSKKKNLSFTVYRRVIMPEFRS